MTVAGTTGDLYFEKDDVGKSISNPPPPAPPNDLPPAVQKVEAAKPVTVKSRMADENPDGSIRDTSTEALRPGNDLQLRRFDDEQTKPKEEKPEAKPAEKPPAPEQKPPEAPKLYAGKFKTPEDIEKAYQELESKFTRTSQEKADLERRSTAAAAAPPPPPPQKTPEQLAAEKTEADRILNEFVSNPLKFTNDIKERAKQETLIALSAQQLTEKWRKDNPDLVEHEIRVAFEATQLMQSDPELAKNPIALFSKATENFRAFTGKIRTEGAKEALTQETRVVPLVSSTAPAATEQPEGKAPLTSDQAYDLHLKMLKEQEQRSHRGLRR